MKRKVSSRRPNVDPTLFWDWDYKKMDFHKAYAAVIARILERGNEKEWEEMIRFYGNEKVVDTIKNEIFYFPTYIIPKIKDYFSISEKEMKCFKEKRPRKSYWI